MRGKGAKGGSSCVGAKGSNRPKSGSNYVGTKRALREPMDPRNPRVAVSVWELMEPRLALAVWEPIESCAEGIQQI